MLKAFNRLVEYTLLHHRWIFIVFFLLPLSTLFKVYSFLRNWIIIKLKTAPLKHEKRVKYVQQQVREWKAKARDGQQMCTARPGWQSMSFRQGRYKSTMFNVHVDMYDILEINTEKQYVRVEPMASMGQLSKALSRIGWTIPVVPEIEDLTVGGLVMGTGVETSSHKYGLFQNTCRAFELVLCDGSLVRCSREENSDLFYSIPWSYGTLGFLVSAEIDIVPAKKYVKIDYKPVRSLSNAAQAFSEASDDTCSNDFVELLMFSFNHGVLMTGKLVDLVDPDRINAIGSWYKPWFYKHVEAKLKMNGDTEYIPLQDYYHRHTPSLFWELQDIVPFGNNPIFRFLLGWMMPPKVALLKLTQTESIKKLYDTSHIIQDMLVPIDKLEEAVKVFHDAVQVYPLWLCPFKLTPEPGLVHSHSSREEMYVDIGVYGVPKTSNFQAANTTREIEKYVREVRGYQMLYADTYTTREEFRQMFDHTLYDKMRQKYDCATAFPEIYGKVNKNARI